MQVFRLRALIQPTFVLFVLALIGSGCSGPATVQQTAAPPDDPNVVARYTQGVITLDDFERAYAKTAGGRDAAADDSLQAYVDFLERYLDFRLKVQAALDAGLDRDSSLQQEIAAYREQLARPYLLEQEVKAPLLRDLYEKKKEVLSASHILIRVAPDAAPEDTLAAYQKMVALRDSVLAGADFGELAVRHSEDPSAQGDGLGARGYLGYFSGGRMVKAFEDWAYRTPPGEVSPVFRTRYGYHIIQVHERKPRPDDIHLRHIMVRPKGQTAADTAAALARLDSIRTMLAAGEPFEKLAETYSDDKGSARNGGDLGWISYDSPLITPLHQAAFALENPGDVSEPVLTRFGYHLLKLDERRSLPSFEEDLPNLEKTLARLPRSNDAQKAFTRGIRERLGVTVDSALVERVFAVDQGDSTFYLLSRGSLPDSLRALPFATMGQATYTVGALLDFARSKTSPRRIDNRRLLYDTIDRFLDDRAIDLEVSALEERDPTFRETMQEFRDGLLLFRLMEDSVWTVASTDSAGLYAYYQAHADAYWFPERTRVIAFHHRSDSLLNALKARMEAGESVATIAREAYEDPLNTLRIDTTYLSGPTNSVYDRALDLPAGGLSDVISQAKGFVLLRNDGLEPPRAKTFEEARAEVINDYQQELEQALVQRLRARYKARTYPERLVQAFAAERRGRSVSSATQ